MPTINLLWTGGLDSTFRLCHLSQYAVTVQPYYIKEKRKSMKNEIRAMDKIRVLLSKNSNKEFSILPTIYVDRDTIAADAELTQSWNVLHEKYLIGSQYEYLARYAKQQNIKLEVGIEASTRSKAATALKSEGCLTKANYLISSTICNWGYLYLDATQASDDMINIFGNMHFPELLFSIDKLEEIRLLREWGMNDVVKTTWFCHNPVLGKPCGHCNPCRDALNEGLAWRVPLSGRILGTLRIPFHFACTVFSVLRRKLHKIK